jgi:hypothetical protein
MNSRSKFRCTSRKLKTSKMPIIRAEIRSSQPLFHSIRARNHPRLPLNCSQTRTSTLSKISFLTSQPKNYMPLSNQSGSTSWAKRKDCSMRIKSKRSKETITKASRKEMRGSTSSNGLSITSSTPSQFTALIMLMLEKVRITKMQALGPWIELNPLALNSTTS